MRVDFVAREAVSLFNQSMELKLEVRNIFAQGYSEFQKREGNRIYYNKYDVGTSVALSLNLMF
jgi:hypothetical protein